MTGLCVPLYRSGPGARKNRYILHKKRTLAGYNTV